MQLFELVSPRLFRPLAGPNRAFYAELLLLLWEECRHTADYSISRAEAVSRAEDYFAALAKPLALDADGAGDGKSKNIQQFRNVKDCDTKASRLPRLPYPLQLFAVFLARFRFSSYLCTR